MLSTVFSGTVFYFFFSQFSPEIGHFVLLSFQYIAFAKWLLLPLFKVLYVSLRI